MSGFNGFKRDPWGRTGGGVRGGGDGTKTDKGVNPGLYLIGAPRDWAGFSRMVMVVSVSFSGASDSYSGIIGAEETKQQQIKTDLIPGLFLSVGPSVSVLLHLLRFGSEQTERTDVCSPPGGFTHTFNHIQVFNLTSVTAPVLEV